MKTGLVSITFRDLSPRQIVDLVAGAGLDGIEWGGDVHVPHGEFTVADHVRRMTTGAGLAVAAYGSYYRAVESEGAGLHFEDVLETARRLGAPTVRVWAGRQGSADATAAYRAHVVKDLRRVGSLAQNVGMTVAIEYHGHTLTDTSESAQALIAAIDHPRVKLYWQPPAGESFVSCLSGLRAVLPHLLNLHIFQWQLRDGKHDQRPLAEGATVWRKYLGAVAVAGGEHWGLLEFVRGGAPEQFMMDAATLKQWVQALEPGSTGDDR